MTASIVKVGARLYVENAPYPSKEALKKAGCKWDADRRQWWIGAAKSAELAACVEAINNPAPAPTGKGLPTASEHDDRRVYAKVNYRGRPFYVIAESHENGRCMVCPLSGAGFWVAMADCELVKTYAPREYRGRTEFTTLGGIRRFIDKQKRLAAGNVPQCAACGLRNAHLIEDLEDGAMKCLKCCDMPSE